MTHGSLFSGIGGFDLAAEWMGWENKFHCEWNEFGQKVLHHYWPEAELFTDIKKSNFTKYANKIDILSGGFPCQPYSAAGKRLGKEDDRHIWPEMLRAIQEIRPRWVVGENVRGLTNWNGGVVFDEVQADLEAQGYEVLPFLLPACAVNAPHRRDRIWFVAYSTSEGGRQFASENSGGEDRRLDNDGKIWDAADTDRHGGRCLCRQQSEQPFEAYYKPCDTCCERDSPNSNSYGLERCLSSVINRQVSSKEKHDEKRIPTRTRGIQFKNFPTVSPLCNGDDGLSDRLDSITFPKWRNESIKAGGNAIVPQVVHQIFKAIEQYEKLNNSITTTS